MYIKEKVYDKHSVVSKPGDVYKVMLRVFNFKDEDAMKEHFYVIGCNARNEIKYIELSSLGILNASIVHPREVFAPAIKHRVSSIVLCHNHPSGDTTPSEDDNKLTKRLIEAGRLLGIEVLDHLIITEDAYFSFSEGNKMGQDEEDNAKNSY